MAMPMAMEESAHGYELVGGGRSDKWLVLRTAGPLLLAIAGSALTPLPCAFSLAGARSRATHCALPAARCTARCAIRREALPHDARRDARARRTRPTEAAHTHHRTRLTQRPPACTQSRISDTDTALADTDPH